MHKMLNRLCHSIRGYFSQLDIGIKKKKRIKLNVNNVTFDKITFVIMVYWPVTEEISAK